MKLTHRLHIKQLVGIGFGLVLFLALLIGLAGLAAYRISQQQNDLIQTRSRINDLTLNLQILTMERADTLRRYLELGDARLRLRYQSQRAEYVTIYTELAGLLRNQQEALALQQVATADDAFDDLAEDTFSLYQKGGIVEAQLLWRDQGTILQGEISAAAETWNQIQADNNELIIQQARQTETIAVNSINIFIILILLAGIAAGVIITRSITQPISDLVEDTKSIDVDLTTRVEPSGPREIIFLGESINQMANRLLESRRIIQLHKEQLEHELLAASQTQLSFLPKTTPQINGLDVAFHWQSARELAGDFYTYVQLPNRRSGFVLGDVVGKGAAAAMASALTLGLVESHIAAYDRPEGLLKRLNRELCLRFNSKRLKVACTYGIFDETTGDFTVANAGCIFPYLRRGDELCEIDVWGVPLGLSPSFEYRAQQLSLCPGDLLLLSSDGLVEAHNQAGALFGFDRLQATLKQIPQEAMAQEAITYLVRALETFTNTSELSDDVTLIVIRVTEPRAVLTEID